LLSAGILSFLPESLKIPILPLVKEIGSVCPESVPPFKRNEVATAREILSIQKLSFFLIDLITPEIIKIDSRAIPFALDQWLLTPNLKDF